MNSLDVYEMWKAGKQGKEVGCQQGCERIWGSYDCWNCPDDNSPTHKQIRSYLNEIAQIIIHQQANNCMKEKELKK